MGMDVWWERTANSLADDDQSMTCNNVNTVGLIHTAYCSLSSSADAKAGRRYGYDYIKNV